MNVLTGKDFTSNMLKSTAKTWFSQSPPVLLKTQLNLTQLKMDRAFKSIGRNLWLTLLITTYVCVRTSFCGATYFNLSTHTKSPLSKINTYKS